MNNQLSLERIIEIIEGFGLERSDAELYVYLAKKGPKSIKEIVKQMKMTDPNVYDSLKRLASHGYVSSRKEQQTLFFALEFEQIIERMISKKNKEAQLSQKAINELFDSWYMTTLVDPTE